MPEYVEFGNIVEKNGCTIRENNLKIQHKLQVGDLVEVQRDEWFGDGACSMSRERLWIVYCGRDCDGSMLYWLAKTRKDKWNDINIGVNTYRTGYSKDEDEMSFGQKIYYGVCGGFAEDQLTKIEVTEELKSGVGALHWENI
jgi:hypothetical protein